MAFKEELKSSIDDIVSSEGLSPDKAFVFFAATEILGVDEDDAYESVFIGGKNDLCLDFGYIDEQNEEIILIQGKYSENINRDNIRAFKEIPEILNNGLRIKELGGSEEIQEFAKKYRKHRKAFSCKQYFFHIGCLSKALKAEFENIIEYDLEKTQKGYLDKKISMYSANIPEVIELPMNSYFKLDDVPGQPRCAVVTIEIRTLWDLYQEYKTGLFNDNIRLHAGEKTEANKTMKETLIGNEASNFIFYNNGITILCESFREKKDKHICDVKQPFLTLNHPQIINGAQTTFTVGKLCESEIPSNATIMLRIFCPPKNKPDEFREKVIRFNNTQTPVTSRDFRSNDAIQKKLSEAFLSWNPPYFYECKLGLWNTLSKAQKSRFKRKNSKAFRLIYNQIMAQCALAWEGKPASAKNDKKLIFVKKIENGIYEDVFPDNCYKPEKCQHYLLAYELNELFQKKKKEWARTLQETKDEDELKKLEQDRFLTHFNFFGIASIGYIYRKYLEKKGMNCKTLLEERTFEKLFTFIKKIFKTVLKQEQKICERTDTIFNINNWFKKDSNFKDTITSEIDDNLSALDI